MFSQCRFIFERIQYERLYSLYQVESTSSLYKIQPTPQVFSISILLYQLKQAHKCQLLLDLPTHYSDTSHKSKYRYNQQERTAKFYIFFPSLLWERSKDEDKSQTSSLDCDYRRPSPKTNIHQIYESLICFHCVLHRPIYLQGHFVH